MLCPLVPLFLLTLGYYLSCCCNYIPDKGNLRKEGFVCVHRLRAQSVIEEMAWWGHEAVTHIVFIHHKQRNECWCSTCFLVWSVNSAHGAVYPHLGSVCPLQLAQYNSPLIGMPRSWFPWWYLLVDNQKASFQVSFSYSLPFLLWCFLHILPLSQESKETWIVLSLFQSSSTYLWDGSFLI